MHAGVDPDLPQMISCSWVGGQPTLSLIPHTDPPTLAAAAQAFAALHYAQHQPVSIPADHSQHTKQATPPTSEDAGQAIRNISTTASKVKALAADDLGERVPRGNAVLEEDRGQQISNSLGNAPPSSSKAARISRDQQPTVFQAGFAGHGTTLDAANSLGHDHRSSSANPAASPSLCDTAHGVSKAAAAASQQLHSSADLSQLPRQRPDLANASDQSATSHTNPVSQLAAVRVAEAGEKLLDSAAVGCLESGPSQQGAPLHWADPGPRARPSQNHTQDPPKLPTPRAGPLPTLAKPSPDLTNASAAAASGLLVFEDRWGAVCPVHVACACCILQLGWLQDFVVQAAYVQQTQTPVCMCHSRGSVAADEHRPLYVRYNWQVTIDKTLFGEESLGLPTAPWTRQKPYFRLMCMSM